MVRQGSMSLDRIDGFHSVYKHSDADRQMSKWRDRLKYYYPDLYSHAVETRFRHNPDKVVPKELLVLDDQDVLYSFRVNNATGSAEIQTIN